MPNLVTIGDLKRLTGKPAHTINYAVERHGPAPIARIGIARVWNCSQVPEILESIERTSGVLTEETAK